MRYCKSMAKLHGPIKERVSDIVRRSENNGKQTSGVMMRMTPEERFSIGKAANELGLSMSLYVLTAHEVLQEKLRERNRS